jgi:hypothetical protein
VFDGGYRALEDVCAAKELNSPPRLHVVSAPVGSGETSSASTH